MGFIKKTSKFRMNMSIQRYFYHRDFENWRIAAVRSRQKLDVLSSQAKCAGAMASSRDARDGGLDGNSSFGVPVCQMVLGQLGTF